MKKIWYHFFDINEGDQRKIIHSFSNLEFKFYELNPSHNDGMGLVFFNQVSQSLYDFLYEVSQAGNNRILVISTSLSELDSEIPWRLIHSGASDVLNLDNSHKVIEKIIARFKRWIAIEEVIESSSVSKFLIGKSKEWKSVLREIVEMACFTDSAVLITGESGTGKELIARLIHMLDSKRNKQELVLLDCTTIIPELSGSEFFGHERGAFTGAITARDGAFALAKESTLFLDEVGELPLNLQTQLLRVIQEHTFKRVGGNTWHNTDFRLICATNKDLVEAVKQGKFRSDLYYRIAQWTCILPPLRKRCEDILPLARYFINLLLQTGETPELDKTVCEHLLKREYPGNIRELKQLISRIVFHYVGIGPITIGDIPDEERLLAELNSKTLDNSFEQDVRKAFASCLSLKEIRSIVENIAIKLALSEGNGNIHQAAKKLGITDRALQMRRASERQRKQSLNKNNLSNNQININ